MASQVNPTLTIPNLPQIQEPNRTAFRFIGNLLAKIQRGARSGTLNPDQKPSAATLGISDAGLQFFATDYARLYRWTGLAWEDSADAPNRFQIVLFAQAPEPPIGWARCDGRTVVRSTSSGGVTSYATPVIPNLNERQYWVRL